MAIQIDADVEYKACSQKSIRKNDEQVEDSHTEAKHTDIDDYEFKSLYQQFQSITLSENGFCEKNFPQKVCFFI
jgi:hypothetical protein